jgi:adenylate cyclase
MLRASLRERDRMSIRTKFFAPARERIKDTFGKFVDPRIVSRLIGGPNGDIERAECRVVTISVSEIKRFSSIAEGLPPLAMVNLLNGYFRTVAEVIHAHHGVIDKHIAGTVMAFWSPPFSPGDSHARDACLAALKQQSALAAFHATLPEITGLGRDAPEPAARVGIATGEVVVGPIGSPSARSYTVLGGTVNVAMRLVDVNKVYDTSVIITEDTQRLAHEAIEARELDIVTAAGKTEPIRIYEVMAPSGGLDAAQAELRDRFASALAAYRAQDWARAETLFGGCLRIAPGDGPSAAYIERLAVLRSAPPGEGWDGVWRHKTK